MLGRVIEEYGEECRNEGRNEGRIDGAITMGRSMGLTNAQLIDSVSKSCNTTESVVKKHLSKMNMK